MKKKKRFLKKDLDIYKEKLLNLRDEMYAQIKDLSEDTLMKSQKEMSGDISGYGIHMADVASDNYERDFNLGLVSSERKILREIDDALKRVEEKDYGACLECGCEITKRRLNAIPYARHCKQCQEEIEQKDQMR
ncbi:MAG: TraR/DksA C4-type zinc finger protein [Candidatus Omnitrophica bacterium]|nr:TraR/DksA C4-type zinc finger protein [Candidatus Omnitrophota bacterium]